MEIPIELWANENRFSKEVNNLIVESVICYKHGANRASLFFSYLGFYTYIKESLIKGKKPNNIDQGRWDNIQAEIQNDDKWEKRVFEELTNSSSPVFNIKEDIRQQTKYWKDRRNDCAHFKSNEIKSHHVESFWSFLTSNLNKITIEGGKANLLKKFIDHFDITKTPPNTDITNLIREIERTIELVEFDQFLKELTATIDPYDYYTEIMMDLYNEIINICSSDFANILSVYLKGTNNKDIELIAAFPDKINFMDYSPSEVRELWKVRIFNNINDRFMFDIYAALLRNNLIPANQLDEALEQIFDKFNHTRHRIPSDLTIKATIANSKFGEIIFRKTIIEDELKTFMFINLKCGLIIFYIENFSLKVETVKTLCAMISYSNCSWWLRDSLLEVFRKNNDIKIKFHEIASQNGITIPVEFN